MSAGSQEVKETVETKTRSNVSHTRDPEAKTLSGLGKITKYISVRQDDYLEMAVHKMRRANVKAAIVEDTDGQMLGMVTEREIYKHLMYRSRCGFEQPRIASYKDFYVAETMIKNPAALDSKMAPEKALKKMLALGYNFMPVMKDDKPVGILSLNDLRHLVHKDEGASCNEKSPALADFVAMRGRSMKILANPANRA